MKSGMDLLTNPLNKAHCFARRAATLAEKDDFDGAIELYRQANDQLTLISENNIFEPMMRASIQNQLIENDWHIHVLTLRSKALLESNYDEAADSREIDCSQKSDKMDKEDDDVVVVDVFSHSQFLFDSLNPNRTLMVQKRYRSASSPSSSRNQLMSAKENKHWSGFGSFKKLPKTDAIREEELLEMAKVKEQLASFPKQ